MGILDIGARVLTRYEADVTQQIAALESVKGAEGQLAQQQAAAAGARRDQLQQWTQELGKVAIAFAALQKAGEFVWDSMKLKQHEARLEIAATGIDVDRLSAAFGGLKDHLEVLEFAQRANHSAFQLTNDELEKVAKAVRYYTEQGFDAKQVQEDFTNALVTGRTRALAPYGFQVQGLGETVDLAGDKLSGFQKKAQNVHEVLGFVEKSTKGAGEGMGAFGEDADRAAVSLKDAWDQTKQQFADMGEELVPLLQALAQAVGYIGQLVELAKQIPGAGNGLLGTFSQMDADAEDNPDGPGWIAQALRGGTFGWMMGDRGTFSQAKELVKEVDKAKHDAEITATRNVEQFKAEEKEFFKNFGDQFKPLGGGLEEAAKYIAQSSEQSAREAAQKAAEEWKAQHAKILAAITKQVKEDGDELVAALESSSKFAPSGSHVTGRAEAERLLADGMPYTTDPETGEPIFSNNVMSQYQRNGLYGGDAHDQSADRPADLGKIVSEITPLFDKLLQLDTKEATGIEKSILTKLFGPVDEFKLYEAAFKGLEKASTNAFNAWIEGSESAGSAFKKAVGQTIEAIADQMLIESLKYGAYAIASLVPGPTFNPAAAAGYALSAAEFAAGAAAAGVLAHEMGASWGVGTASAGGSSSGAAPSGPTSGGGGQAAGPIIVYGDNYADDSPRMRQVRAQKLVNLALGSSGGGSF